MATKAAEYDEADHGKAGRIVALRVKQISEPAKPSRVAEVGAGLRDGDARLFETSRCQLQAQAHQILHGGDAHMIGEVHGLGGCVRRDQNRMR